MTSQVDPDHTLHNFRPSVASQVNFASSPIRTLHKPRFDGIDQIPGLILTTDYNISYQEVLSVEENSQDSNLDASLSSNNS